MSYDALEIPKLTSIPEDSAHLNFFEEQQLKRQSDKGKIRKMDQNYSSKFEQKNQKLKITTVI